uniref:Tudor domain-containing protein n=1 Tax=Noctiluca scintillans TaxID=2966 RepID=A0A7S1ATL4_NOCSC
MEANEASQEMDLTRSRSVRLTAADLEILRVDGERWMRRIERLSPDVVFEVVEIENGTGYEAKIDCATPGGAKAAELCLRAVLSASCDRAVDMRVLPDSAGLVEVLEVPESAAGTVHPATLADEWDVIAAYVAKKDSIKARPRADAAQVELGKIFGLAVGQQVEVRYDTDWYHGTAIGFTEGTVLVEWLGGGEAEIPVIDVKASKRGPPVKPPPTHGVLVIIGEARPRTGASFQVMAAVDRKVHGHFSERHAPQSSGSLFGFDVNIITLPPVDGGACSKNRSKIASASEALVEILGKRAFVAGEADERRKAQSILTELVPQAGPFGDASSIPEDLNDCCSKVRVPYTAVSAISGPDRAQLSQFELESGCLAFWLPIGTPAADRAASQGVRVGGCLMEIGAAVEAKYEGAWCGATLMGAKASGKVKIAWDFDGSEVLVLSDNVRSADAAQRKRQQSLKAPRILAIIGSERGRRLCALKVMAISEELCPGLWTSALKDAVSEAQDGLPEDEIICGISAEPFDGSNLELEWLQGSEGQHALTSAARAARCLIQLVGKSLFFGGFSDQIERGREYVRWACLSRRGGTPGPRAGGLSVTDADMRDDITTMLIQELQATWMRPDRLRSVEHETETIIFFDDGGGSALEQGSRRLLICGWSDPHRCTAKAKLEDIGSSASATTAKFAPEHSSGKRHLETSESTAEPDAKRSNTDQSNPREALKTIAWPTTINQWGQLQKKIWFGHPKLQNGWIRCWSRSQDREYYLRLKDMKTTFELNEVLFKE